MKTKSSGFTLIEMMITIATLAIIVAIAFPSYQDHIRKARRADGKALLGNMAQQLERCYTKFGQYNNAGCTITDGSTQESEDGYYLATATVAATTYSLSAAPQNGQENDTLCNDLIISQAGEQDIGSGATGTVDRCW